MRKWIILLVLIIAGFLGYNYVYQDHRNIESETAEFILTAEDLTNEFEINPYEAEAIYLNKTLVISGAISDVSTSQITINNKVFCQLSNETKALKSGEKITLKGRFIGYDSLLEEIKLDQCYIINKP